MGKRGRPKKDKADKVKGKRGRPKKIAIDNIVAIDKAEHIKTTESLSKIPYTPTTQTHSFCPDCGVELESIAIDDPNLDGEGETYGCPRCQVEVTKDNEITLTITNDGMRLDFNSLTINKLDE